jgi:hypothetical protein
MEKFPHSQETFLESLNQDVFEVYRCCALLLFVAPWISGSSFFPVLTLRTVEFGIRKENDTANQRISGRIYINLQKRLSCNQDTPTERRWTER